MRSRKQNRYQTYVFDSEFDSDPNSNKKWRDMLGPEYKGGVPSAWMDGHGLRDKDKLWDFVESLSFGEHKFKSIEDIEDAAEKLLEEISEE